MDKASIQWILSFCLFFLINPLESLQWFEEFDERIAWSFEGELLVFKPNLDHLNYAKRYALKNVSITSTTVVGGSYQIYNGLADEKELRMPFRFNTGFRGTLGARFQDYNLESTLAWTTFFSSSQASEHGVMTDLFNGSLLQGPSSVINYGTAIGQISAFASPPSTFASARYSIQLDQLDLKFFKKLCVCRQIIIEPVIGLSGIVIHQKFQTTFRQTPGSSSAIPFLSMDIEHRQHLRFEGFGPKIGCMSHWILTPQISFFGSLVGALYFGGFDRKQAAVEKGTIVTQLTDVSETAANISLNHHDRIKDVKFSGTIQLGLEYTMSFYCDRLKGVARFGWEGQWYPNLNMLSLYSSTGSIANIDDPAINNSGKPAMIGGDLSLSGWIISLFIGF